EDTGAQGAAQVWPLHPCDSREIAEDARLVRTCRAMDADVRVLHSRRAASDSLCGRNHRTGASGLRPLRLQRSTLLVVIVHSSWLFSGGAVEAGIALGS